MATKDGVDRDLRDLHSLRAAHKLIHVIRSAVVPLAFAIALTFGCDKSGEGASTAKDEPKPCLTEEAQTVTHDPGFKESYTRCATGSRAIGGPATIACLEKGTGLPEDCGLCYSYYKACVLRHCFNACKTTRLEPNCRLCSRNNCRGSFYRCAGTSDVFPGSPDPG
ncbi:MAG: hypothetical protein AAF436_17265 [Myxococcota bacterium]